MAPTTVKKNASVNIIDCADYFKDRASDMEFVYSVMAEIKTRAEKNAIAGADELIQKRIMELETECKKREMECMVKDKKLQKCLPFGILGCLVFTSGIVVSCVTILVIQILANVKIVDYNVLLFILVGGLGLFHTSIATVKGWKRYLNNENGKRHI